MSNQIISKNDFYSSTDISSLKVTTDGNYFYSNYISSNKYCVHSTANDNYFINNEFYGGLEFNNGEEFSDSFSDGSLSSYINSSNSMVYTSGGRDDSYSLMIRYPSNKSGMLTKDISGQNISVDLYVRNVSGNIEWNKLDGTTLKTLTFESSGNWELVSDSYTTRPTHRDVRRIKINYQLLDDIQNIYPSSGSGADWEDIDNVYDGDDGTWAENEITPNSWGDTLTLYINSGTHYGSGMKFNAYYHSDVINLIDLDIYDLSSNSWIDVYQGSYSDKIWVSKYINKNIVSDRVRVKFYNDWDAVVDVAQLFGFQFIGRLNAHLDDLNISSQNELYEIIYDKGNNFWNNSTIGNYYSTYSNSGTNGIGYKSSQISGGSNWDKYPLMSGGVAGRNPSNFGMVVNNTIDGIENFNYNSFTSAKTSGTTPITYDWNLEEGYTSTDTNPTQYYLSANTYYPNLVAKDSGNYYSSDVSLLQISDRGDIGFDAHTTNYKTFTQGNLTVKLGTVEWT